MKSGATFERRFVLVSPEEHDLPGVERWVARDERLRRTVTAFVVTSVAPSAVRRSAGRAASIGDPRLARVLASGRSDGRSDGRHADDADKATYVVTERAAGTSLSALLSRRNLPHSLAAGIVGSLAQALQPVAARGVHHGAIRASAVTVTDAGSVQLSGLGVDGELTVQAGLGAAGTERGDAEALARLYVQALVGPDADAASPGDLPADVPAQARALATRVMAGDPPARLHELAAALRSSRAAMRGFAAQVRSLPVRPEVLASDVREAFGRSGDEVAASATLAAAAHAAERAAAITHAGDAIAYAVAAEHLGDVARPLLEAEAARKDREARALAAREAAAKAAAATPAEERELFDDLESWDVIAEDQNATVPPSAWEALMERVQRHWPRSQLVAARVAEAHARARRPGPIIGAPIVIGLGLVGVVVAVAIALSLMEAPVVIDGDRYNPPQNTYPAFTYPATTYTPAPEPSPEG